jgi:putative tricarboxylic transport membrane protein
MLRILPPSIVIVAVTVSTVATPVAAQPVYQHLRIIAPAAPGGGWDQTARVMQQVLQRAGIVRTSSVENIPGAAGTLGLARFISTERGNGDVVMVSGLIMLGAIVTHASAVTLREVTPIARLTGEYEVIVVPAASPFRSLDELIRTFRERPESISWGGGSAGGTDQILAGLVADAVGVSPRRVNYIAFSGGGESMSAILGGQVSAGINGLAEFAPQIEAGTVRVLGISSAERLPGLAAPTLREQGVDVELENWRSLVAPPGIVPADRERLERAVETMVRSAEWRQELQRYRWIDRYLAGDAFAQFAQTEDQRVRAILTKLGLGTGETTPHTAGVYPLLVLAGLVFCLVVAAVETVRSRAASTMDDRRPTIDDGRSTMDDGRWTMDDERWQPAALIAIGMVIELALMERAGFVLASAALFWLTARAFDTQHPGRDALFALAISTATYFLFVHVLNVTLPAGFIARYF